MGEVNPVDLAANFSTGGLYGVAKGAEKAIDTGKVGAGAADALASYGTLGSIAQPTLGTRNALQLETAIAIWRGGSQQFRSGRNRERLPVLFRI